MHPLVAKENGSPFRRKATAHPTHLARIEVSRAHYLIRISWCLIDLLLCWSLARRRMLVKKHHKHNKPGLFQQHQHHGHHVKYLSTNHHLHPTLSHICHHNYSNTTSTTLPTTSPDLKPVKHLISTTYFNCCHLLDYDSQQQPTSSSTSLHWDSQREISQQESMCCGNTCYKQRSNVEATRWH